MQPSVDYKCCNRRQQKGLLSAASSQCRRCSRCDGFVLQAMGPFRTRCDTGGSGITGISWRCGPLETRLLIKRPLATVSFGLRRWRACFICPAQASRAVIIERFARRVILTILLAVCTGWIVVICALSKRSKRSLAHCACRRRISNSGQRVGNINANLEAIHFMRGDVRRIHIASLAIVVIEHALVVGVASLESQTIFRLVEVIGGSGLNQVCQVHLQARAEVVASLKSCVRGIVSRRPFQSAEEQVLP